MIAQLMVYLKDDAIKKTVYVTVGTLVASFFAYLLQIFLGRTMSVAEYGLFNAALSFTTLLTFFNSGISIALIKTITNLLGIKKNDEVASLFKYFVKAFLLFGIFIFILFTFFNTFFVNLFNIPHPEYFMFFGIYMISRYAMVTPLAFTQSLLLFKPYSKYLAFSSLLRLLSAGGLAYLGYTVGIIYFGMSIAECIALFPIFILIWKQIKSKKVVNVKPYLSNILKIGIPIMISYFGLIFLNTIDVLVIKRYFDANATGLYVGAATMGKIILFGTSPIGIVMLPQISALKAKNKDYRKKFYILAMLQILAVTSLLSAFLLFPKAITLIIFGEKFAGSIALLPIYSIFIACYSLVGFAVNFFVAVDKPKTAYLLIPASIVQVIFLYFFHTSPSQVIYVNISILIALLGILLMYMYKELRGAGSN